MACRASPGLQGLTWSAGAWWCGRSGRRRCGTRRRCRRARRGSGHRAPAGSAPPPAPASPWPCRTHLCHTRTACSSSAAGSTCGDTPGRGHLPHLRGHLSHLWGTPVTPGHGHLSHLWMGTCDICVWTPVTPAQVCRQHNTPPTIPWSPPRHHPIPSSVTHPRSQGGFPHLAAPAGAHLSHLSHLCSQHSPPSPRGAPCSLTWRRCRR